MALQPDPPFPKGRGNVIRSEDWNETVNEVVRLDTAKLNQTGGTVSGNLAVTGNLSSSGTISGRLANGSVGPSQLTDNAVTAGRIAPGSIAVDRLQGGYWHRNLIVTLEGNARREYYVEPHFTYTGERNQPPTFLSHPLVFIAASTLSLFDYWFGYQTYTETGLDRYGFHSVVVQNRTGDPIQLHITSYIQGLSALPFQPT